MYLPNDIIGGPVRLQLILITVHESIATDECDDWPSYLIIIDRLQKPPRGLYLRNQLIYCHQPITVHYFSFFFRFGLDCFCLCKVNILDSATMTSYTDSGDHIIQCVSEGNKDLVQSNSEILPNGDSGDVKFKVYFKDRKCTRIFIIIFWMCFTVDYY